jgi:mono/diheme cytochrome c family protein
MTENRKKLRAAPTIIRMMGVSMILLLGTRQIQLGTAQTERLASKRPLSQKADKKLNPSALFKKHCQKCHGEDGKGDDSRDTFPEIPDFTDEKWQKGRSDAELVSSILDGKGTAMPQFANKVSKEEVKGLANFVRSFVSGEIKPMSAMGDDFDKRLQELFDQLKELRKQFQNLSKQPGEP